MTDLADIRKRRPAAPLYDGVHELHLERRNVFGLVDLDLGLFRDLGDAFGEFLH
jgi:hypothetical protein